MANGTAIQFSFGFDLSGLQSGASKAGAIVNRAMGRISGSSMLAFGAAAGAATFAFNKIMLVAEATAGKVNAVFQQGSALNNLSERTGVAAGRLYQMQKALKSVRVDADLLGPSIAHMQRNITTATPRAQAALAELGIKMDSLKAMTPDQQFQAIGQAIGKLSDPAKKTADAMAIFGLSGQQMLPLFNSASAMSAMGGKLTEQAQVFGESSAEFASAAASIAKAGKMFQGFYVGMAQGVATTLNQLFASLGTIDFVEKGRAVGEILAKIGAYAVRLPGYFVGAGYALMSGLSASVELCAMLVNFAWQGLERAGNALLSGLAGCAYIGASLVNFVWHGLEGAGDIFMAALHLAAGVAKTIAADLWAMPLELGPALYAGMQAAFQKVMEFFDHGMWDLIKSVAAGLQYALQTAIHKVLDVLPAVIKKMLGIKDVVSKTWEQITSDTGKSLDQHKSKSVGDTLRDFANGYKGTVANLRASAADSMSAASASWKRSTTHNEDVAGAQNWREKAEGYDKKARDPHSNDVVIDSRKWHAMAVGYDQKARAAWARASGQTLGQKPGAIANAWAAAKVSLANQPKDPWAAFRWMKDFVTPGHLLDGKQGFDLATGQMRAITGLHETLTAGGVIRKEQSGLGGGAYGYMRAYGQAAYERNQIDAKRKADEAEKSSVEGTNDRLDDCSDSLDKLVKGLVGG